MSGVRVERTQAFEQLRDESLFLVQIELRKREAVRILNHARTVTNSDTEATLVITLS